MRKIRKGVAGLLALVMLVTMIPIQNLRAENEQTEESENETQVMPLSDEESSESPIESIEVDDIEIIEGMNGYYTEDWNPETEEYEKYYYYGVNPTFTVRFKDGTVLTDQWYNIEYNGEWYYLEVEDDQNPQNQWGVGTHTVNASLMGVSTTFEVNVVENPIESIEIDDIEIIEGTNGRNDSSWNPDTGVYEKYFRYDVNPTFTVRFKDGTVLTDRRHDIIYKGQFYSLNVKENQSLQNQWGIGIHTATATLMGVSTTFEVNIVENPIESIEVDNVEVIEGTNGYYTDEWNPNTEKPEKYFYYDNVQPTFTVRFKDGTVLTDQRNSISYKGQYYFLSVEEDVEDEQSVQNQWGIGSHKATAKLLGISTSFEVIIVETPIESIEIQDVEVIEGTNGWNDSSWNPDTGENEKYFYYNIYPTFTVTFKDGTVSNDCRGGVRYNGEWYVLYDEDNQSVQNPWGIGTHTVTASLMGVSTTFNVNIIESPYTKIEIVNMKPVIENENCNFDWDDRLIYNIPDFSYRVTKNDGTSFLGYYSTDYNLYKDSNLTVSSNQEEKPWTVEGENYFTVKYVGVEKEVRVELQASSPYEYYEENGEIYITGYKECIEKLQLPSEIDGKPVVAIMGVGNTERSLKELEIPDSVRIISEDALHYWQSGLEKITIGSGVTYLSESMFAGCPALTNITISEENQSYCSVDGVVYDKQKTTIVAYPNARGTEFIVPASVTNIDVMFLEKHKKVNMTFEEGSSAFSKEDGVLYNADKTRLISCDETKSGEFVIPDTVAELADNAFMNCSSLTKVTVSPKVTDIAYCAFWNCTSLEEVDLPDTVSSIGKCAFVGCKKLESIELPSNLKTMSDSAFNTTGLKKILIPDSVETIGAYAFSYSKLENVIIGNGVYTIGDRAFCRTPLKAVVIPDSVTNLGQHAFYECKNLESVTVGAGVTAIRESTFSDCSNLKQVELKNKEVLIGSQAFYGCPIEKMNSENIGESIGFYAFSGSSLTSVTISNGVTAIVYGAFSGSRMLKNIDIPETAVQIGGHVFDDTAWYKNQDNGPVYLEHVFYGYKGDMAEKTRLEMQDGTTVIADYALEGKTNLIEVTLPKEIVTIGNRSFFGCSNLTEISIPASVETIGEYAFGQCKNLETIHVDPDNAYYTSIDGVLFNKDCTRLIWCPKKDGDSYTVPDTVQVISTSAFGCSGLKEIVIKNKDVELEYGSIGYNYLGAHGGLKWEDTVLVCNQDSTAYDYAEDNLLPTEEIKQTDCLSYYTHDGKATIIDCDASVTRAVVIPETIEDCPITSICAGAFENWLAESETNTLYYIGDEEAWNAIEKNTADFENIKVVFNYVGLSSNEVKLDATKGEIDSDVELVVTKVEDKNIVEDALANYGESFIVNDSVIYDLSLWKAEEKVQPNGSVTVSLPVSESMDGENCKVFYIDDSGNATDMNAVYKDGYMVFTTDHFSYYAVVEGKAFITGDINGDGKVNNKDATRLLQYLSDWDVEVVEAALDVNGDGKVNNKDATRLLQYLSGWDVEIHSKELVNSDLQYNYYKCSDCGMTSQEFNDKEYTIELEDGQTTTVVGHFDLKMAEEILPLINERRAIFGAKPLTMAAIDSPLGQAAIIRAYEASYKFDHTRPNGERGITSLYPFARTEGENLAKGQTSADEVMTDWIASTTHDDNITHFSWRRVGIAVFARKVPSGYYVNTFCQMFSSWPN